MSKLSRFNTKSALTKEHGDSIRYSKGIGPFGKKSGGDGAVVTPVPIPNTEVKHRSGEDSMARKASENSAPPGFFLFGGDQPLFQWDILQFAYLKFL